MAITFKSNIQNKQMNSFLNLTNVTNKNAKTQQINFSNNLSNKNLAAKSTEKIFSEENLYNNSFFDSDVLDLHTSTKRNNISDLYTSSTSQNMYNFDNTSFYAEVNQKLNNLSATNKTDNLQSNNTTQSDKSSSDFYSEVNQKLNDISAIFGINSEADNNTNTNMTGINPFANFSSFSLNDIASTGLPTVGNLTSADVDLSIMSYFDNTDFYKSVNQSLNSSSANATGNNGSNGTLASTMSEFKGFGDYNTFPYQPKSSNLKKCKHKKGVYKDKTTGKYWKKDSSGWYVDVTSTYSKKSHK